MNRSQPAQPVDQGGHDQLVPVAAGSVSRADDAVAERRSPVAQPRPREASQRVEERAVVAQHLVRFADGGSGAGHVLDEPEVTRPERGERVEPQEWVVDQRRRGVEELGAQRDRDVHVASADGVARQAEPLGQRSGIAAGVLHELQHRPRHVTGHLAPYHLAVPAQAAPRRSREPWGGARPDACTVCCIAR
jgi:hypothetical protein